MRWRVLWRGARSFTDDRLVDMRAPPPEEPLHWTAVAFPLVVIFGIPALLVYCR